MKTSFSFPKVARIFHRRHHDVGHIKWSRNGEVITDASYEITEWELKTHHRLQAQSELQRLSN